MRRPGSQFDLERFRAVIAERVGLQFDDAKLGFLDDILDRRLQARRLSSGDYVSELEGQAAAVEIGALAEMLTVGETYFFRNNQQFRALAETVLPARMRVARMPKTLRLLSAGCASGEEAYTLAMVAREAVADASWKILIEAVDINSAALEKAARGRYSSWALRDTPAEIQRKWFRAAGREMILDASVKAAVTFGIANLASDHATVWRPAAYDVIFCRNVLMYFSPEQMRVAVARIARSLAPGGFLFLGHAETLRGVSDQFDLHQTHGTFYYQRKGNAETADWASPSANGIAAGSIPSLIPVLDDGWAEAIRQASDRIAALVPATVVEAPPAQPAAPGWDPVAALELFRKERFAEALDLLCAAPPQARIDPDVLLLEATLLSHVGQHAAAEKSCAQLLSIDGLNAGANYVLALCSEQAGDRAAAAQYDRIAAYLDPGFAMPRLHLGLLARRGGDRDGARREFARARLLLKSEDAFRLLLFGGGFTRDGLIALCESSLGDCGGRW